MNRFKTRLFAANVVGILVLAFALLVGQGYAAQPNAPLAEPVPDAFVFEGRLGNLSGSYDFQFQLFDAATGGNPKSSVVTFPAVTVDTGEYRVSLRTFGSAPFDGDARYLEVKFRLHSTPNAAFTLFGRSNIAYVPYALRSLTAWNLTGNKGTSSGTNFIGTTDAASLVVKTVGTERMRIDTSGNVGVGTSGPIARLEASAAPGNIGLLGTSNARGVVGRLGNISCAGTYAVGGCGGGSGDGVLGRSNSRGVIGVLGDTSCAGVYAVGGCSNSAEVGVHGAADTGRAVEGFSVSGIGVIGDSSTRGVIGTLNRTSCAGSYAVGGCVGSAQAYGVFGRAAFNSGVVGSSDTGNVFLGVTGNSETHVARIDSTGRGFFNGGTQNSGADVAEFIPVTDAPRPGDVVEIDQDHPGKFRIATVANSTAVAGVITTRPGVSLSKEDMAHTDASAPQLALVGRVPVKVTAENGAIHAGDLLVSSSLPGYAMRAPRHPEPGTIIGKALGGLESGTGTIELLVMLR